MCTLVANFRFAKILILESLPPNEFHTGAALHQQIDALLQHYNVDLKIQYISFQGRRDFRKLIDKASSAVRKTGMTPLLQIECHGGDDGLTFANGDFIDWKTLCDILRPLNELTRLNLFICISACFGAYLNREFLPLEPAPFFGVLSTTQEQYPDELLRGFSAFYRTLIETLDGDQAQAAVAAAAPDFYLTDVRRQFILIYGNYLTRMCTPEMYWRRAGGMLAEAQRKGIAAGTVYYYRQLLQEHEVDKFEGFKRQFFMLELFPENATRFPITLTDVGR